MLVYGCILPHPPILVPEIGGPHLGRLQSTLAALANVRDQFHDNRVETVLLISPHGPGTPTAFALADGPALTATMARWGAPQVSMQFEADESLASAAAQAADDAGLCLLRARDWAVDLDWGCTVPLYCLGRPKDVKLVALSASGLGPRDHYRLGEAVGRALHMAGRRVAIVGSCDLSHGLTPDAPSGYCPEGEPFDLDYGRALQGWDVEWILSRSRSQRRLAAEDAVPQTAFVMGTLADHSPTPKVLSYEGPFGVGYLVASIQTDPGREGRPQELHYWDSVGRFA